MIINLVEMWAYGFMTGILLSVFLFLIYYRVVVENKKTNYVSDKTKKLNAPKMEPIYFKLKNFTNQYIRIVERDDNFYKYQHNMNKGWMNEINIESKIYIEKIYERIYFDPLN